MRRNEINLPEAPQRDRPNDLWMCGRTDAEGCSRGPCHKGRCNMDPPCKPRRTWAGKRRRYAAMAVLLVVVFGAALSLTPWTSHYFKPGGLTGQHAQILSGTMSSDRCASCHADATKESWFSLGGSSHVGVTLSDRCLNCHHETFDVESAKWAHNISPEQRTELRLASSRNDGFSIHNFLPGPSFDQNNVECSTCHKEHRGSDANLLSLSDAQCQTCHSSRFAGFSSGHPDWSGWPYDQSKMITFDHRTHSTKHFPASNIDGHPARFDCNACHQRTDDGELTRTVAFESGCASCHDDSLRLQIKSGIALASLPSVGDQTAEGLPSWPEDATGFFDGAVSPLTMLLLARDADAVQALQMIPQGDFSRVDEDDPNQVRCSQSDRRKANWDVAQDRIRGTTRATRQLRRRGL